MGRELMGFVWRQSTKSNFLGRIHRRINEDDNARFRDWLGEFWR